MMMHDVRPPVTGAHRPPCDCAEHLRRLAPEQATGTRDFGRGYMHAVRELERRAA
jgi:hypothetical protein